VAREPGRPGSLRTRTRCRKARRSNSSPLGSFSPKAVVGLVFLPIIVFSTKTDIPPGQITAFGVACVACLTAGALLYSRWAWSWWVALIVAVAVAGWLLSTSGLRSIYEGYAAAGFAVAIVLCLVLGRRAAGNPDAMQLASANIPFRVKVGIVWLAIFFMIATVLVLFKLDTQWIRENFSYIAKGLEYTILLALGAIVLAVVLALFGALGRLSKNPSPTGSPASTPRSSAGRR
jgi:ABC-type amino acid transport system permease subunit